MGFRYNGRTLSIKLEEPEIPLIICRTKCHAALGSQKVDRDDGGIVKVFGNNVQLEW